MSELRARMLRDMTVRGFSPRTHEAYIRQVVGLARYYRRSPAQLSADEVQAYLAQLFQVRKRSWSTCAQAAHAFRFLYHVTLGHPRVDFMITASSFVALSRSGYPRLTAARDRSHDINEQPSRAFMRRSPSPAMNVVTRRPTRCSPR